MEEILGSSPLVFLLFTCGIAGWTAFMTGQAIAATWRPVWQVVPYAFLLGLADRFFVYALFGGDLLSLTGWIIDTAVLIAIGLAAYRATLVRRLCAQYPWLYEPQGLFSLRERLTGS